MIDTEISKVAILQKLIFIFFALGTLAAAWDVTVRRRFGLAVLFLIPALLIAGVAGWAYLIEPNWIQVRRVQIKDAALASILKDTRLVQITDIHLTQGIGFRERQMVRKINALKPDVVIFTGDLFDSRDQIGPALELFRSLQTKLILGIPGDTDLIVVKSQEFENIMSTVMHVLRNRSGQIHLPNGNKLWISGVDHPRRLQQALAGIPTEEPLVVLSPSPDIFHDAAKAGVNLVLTGDTHGGQVGIDFLIRMSEYANRTPYMRGLFKRENTHMYVNRGIGVKTRPIRFLCRPEIALIQAVS